MSTSDCGALNGSPVHGEPGVEDRSSLVVLRIPKLNLRVPIFNGTTAIETHNSTLL
jgi:hypothetical protein